MELIGKAPADEAASKDKAVQIGNAQALIDDHRFDEATRMIEALESRYLDDPAICLLRAQAYAAQEEFGAALAAAEQGLSLDCETKSTVLELFRTRFHVLVRLGRSETALAMAERFLSESFDGPLAERAGILAGRLGDDQARARIAELIRSRQAAKLDDELHVALHQLNGNHQPGLEALAPPNQILVNYAMEEAKLPEQARGSFVARAVWGKKAYELTRDWLFYAPDGRQSALDDLIAEVHHGELERDLSAGRGAVLVACHLGPLPVLVRYLSTHFDNFRFVGAPIKAARMANQMSWGLGRVAVMRRSVEHVRGGGLMGMSAEHRDVYAEPPAPLILNGEKFWFSSFGARLAYRLGVPLYAGQARWDGDRARLNIRKIGEPDGAMTEDAWIDHWRTQYIANIMDTLKFDPANIAVGANWARDNKWQRDF